MADAILSKFEEAIHQIKQTVGQPPQPVHGQAAFPPPPPPAGTDQASTREVAGPVEPDDTNNKLSPVQKALVQAHFGKKVQIQSATFEEFKEQVMKLRPQDRKVVATIGEFITSNSPRGTAVPYGKKDRIKKYWELLRNLD